jgi:hypothetical protein
MGVSARAGRAKKIAPTSPITATAINTKNGRLSNIKKDVWFFIGLSFPGLSEQKEGQPFFRQTSRNKKKQAVRPD